MKNTIFATLAVLLLLCVGLACSSINPFSEKGGKSSNVKANSNKSLTDKAVDTAVGEEKIGVPECDEVVDMLKDYANNPDDNFVVKAGKAMFVNKIREAIKKSVEENKSDKAELAKNCKEFKTELEKYKAEQDAKEKK
jgi:hypothetical protein